MPFRKAVLSLAVLLLATAPLALAQGTYTQLDPPDSDCFTFVFGIDSAGDIVGDYYDTSGSEHGFLLSQGVYTILDYPGGLTSPYGINDVGQIVGSAYVGTQDVAFLYDVLT